MCRFAERGYLRVAIGYTDSIGGIALKGFGRGGFGFDRLHGFTARGNQQGTKNKMEWKKVSHAVHAVVSLPGEQACRDDMRN